MAARVSGWRVCVFLLTECGVNTHNTQMLGSAPTSLVHDLPHDLVALALHLERELTEFLFLTDQDRRL